MGRHWGRSHQSRSERLIAEHEAAVARAAKTLSDEIDKRWAEFNRALDEHRDGHDHTPWDKD